MKKIYRKMIILLIVISVLLFGMKFVYADDLGVQMSLASSSKLKAGETITIDINSIKCPENGIGSMIGKLNYDSNVLEYVSVKGYSDWSPIYTASTGLLGIERNNKTTTMGKIATITFKVKEPLTVDNTKVTYNITDVGITDLVSLSPSVTISVEKENNSSDKGSTSQNGTGDITKISGKNAVKNIASKEKPKSLPKAGEETKLTILSMASIIGILSIVSLIKYLKI